MIAQALYMGYARPGHEEVNFKRILSKRGFKQAEFKRGLTKKVDTFDVEEKA